MDTLAKRLKISRLESGLTQSELAEAASITRQTIAAIERDGGTKEPTKIVKLSLALSVCPEWLLYGTVNNKDVTSYQVEKQYILLTEDEHLLIESYRLMTEIKKQKAIETFEKV